MKFDYHIPTRIIFGRGRVEDIAKMELPGKKALLVISKGKSMKSLGYVERVTKILASTGVETVLYEGVTPNPEIADVVSGTELALANGCDLVVGLGGGSTIDCAKAIALMAKNPGYDIWDYIGDTDHGRELFVKMTGVDIMMDGRIKTGFGYKKIAGALPVIAITTTAGTGSECDPWTVTTNTETNDKLGVGGVVTFPYLAVVDPELMSSVPSMLTAYQGFDALFHCIETYYGTVGNSLSEAYTKMGIEAGAKYLARAIQDGNDMEAREGMAFCNLMGGFALSTAGTTAEHSIAQCVAGFSHDMPHGAALICLCEAFFTFFAKRGVKSLIEVGRMLGEDVDKLPEEERPMAAVYGLRRLRKECGVDKIKMQDWGVDAKNFESMAEKAKRTGLNLFKKDPIMLNEEDVVEILKASYYV